jgi:small subunit ribosomal protein S16
LPVKIRLRRMGAKKKPFYRLVVANSTDARDGRFIESIGYYDPCTEPPNVKVNAEKAAYWLKCGAQPSDTARVLLQKQGIIPGRVPVTPAPAPEVAAPAAKAPAAAKAPKAAPVAAEPVAEAPVEPVAEAPAAPIAAAPAESAVEASAEPVEEAAIPVEDTAAEPVAEAAAEQPAEAKKTRTRKPAETPPTAE